MAKKADTPKPAPEAVRDELEELERAYLTSLENFRLLFSSLKRTESRLVELGLPVAESIAVYARVYTIREKIEEISKAVGQLKDVFNKTLLPRTMEQNNIDTLTISEGHRVTLTTKIFASVKADCRDQAYNWLRENDAADLVTETVNAQTLSSYAKSLAEENKALPEELFNVMSQAATSLTRAKGWNFGDNR